MKFGSRHFENAKTTDLLHEWETFLCQDLASCAEEGKLPSRNGYRARGNISTNWIETQFGSFEKFIEWYSANSKTYEDADPVDPSIFEDREEEGEIPDLESWWEKRYAGKAKRRYIVSAACGGGVVNQKHLDAVNTYRKERNAEFVVLTMKGVTKDDILIDPKLQETADFIGGEIDFNSNLRAMDFRLHPAQVIGITGLKRFGQKDFSLLVAHTKQAMEAVPVATGSFPHLVYTTGCITKQYYNSNRIGRIAEQDETYGGLIVEVVDKNIFHIRDFQFDADGGFVDLGIRYSAEGAEEIGSVIVMGDIHITDTDPLAEKASNEQIAFLKPKKAFYHDLFSGNTINHHVEHSISKQTRIRESQGNLKQELDAVVSWLRSAAQNFAGMEINIVASNHNEWLDKWLEQGLYVKSPENHRIGLQLAPFVLDGKNPLEEYFRKSFALDEPIPSNVRFLRRSDSVKRHGFELALHGDKSHSGRFGSVLALEESFGKCIVGHHHSPKIFRGIRIVGTMTKLNLDYTEGYGSSWLHTNCVLYDNGTTQMLTAINGKWRASF